MYYYFYSITLLGFSPTPRTFHASNSRIVDTCGNYIYLKSSLSCFKKKLIYIYSLCKIGIGTNFVTGTFVAGISSASKNVLEEEILLNIQIQFDTKYI